MKISVLIPAYNASRTLHQAIASVARQSYSPFEILVMDDGSTDETYSIMQSYGSKIKTFHQANAGVAASRNALCRAASGELIAFLDADDVWNPDYLESQRRNYELHPDAVALFTGHLDFCDGSTPHWDDAPANLNIAPATYTAKQFIELYNRRPGPFANLSHLCFPTRVLARLGPNPFQLRMGDDIYFMNRLVLLSPGPVCYLPRSLCAYRLRSGSISSDRLRYVEGEIDAFELLAGEYAELASTRQKKLFLNAFNMKRRLYAKYLLGAHKCTQARKQLRCCLRTALTLESMSKSLVLMALSYIPFRLQPRWPTHR